MLGRVTSMRRVPMGQRHEGVREQVTLIYEVRSDGTLVFSTTIWKNIYKNIDVLNYNLLNKHSCGTVSALVILC